MKVIAVTGGAQGIGRAIGLHFARARYAVSILDPDRQAGEEAAGLFRDEGAGTLFHAGDTASARDIEAWLSATEAELGCPDVLVNNAGIGRNRPFLDLPVDDFDAVIAVNLRGAFLCAQNAARRMVARGRGGAIVNIASTRAFMSEPNTEAYSASKGGIVALTHAMAISLGPFDIRVNCISPGWIDTRNWQFSARASVPVHSERDRAQHPVGRVGRPEDVAEACFYLAEHAGFVTGQNLTVDGGMKVKMIYAE